MPDLLPGLPMPTADTRCSGCHKPIDPDHYAFEHTPAGRVFSCLECFGKADAIRRANRTITAWRGRVPRNRTGASTQAERGEPDRQ